MESGPAFAIGIAVGWMFATVVHQRQTEQKQAEQEEKNNDDAE